MSPADEVQDAPTSNNTNDTARASPMQQLVAPTAVMQPPASERLSPLPEDPRPPTNAALLNISGLPGHSILKTRINNSTERESTENVQKPPRPDAFQLLSEERTAKHETPEPAINVKTEVTKAEPSEEASSGATENELFVGQNEPPNVTSHTPLKRARSEIEEKPSSTTAAPAPRKRANKGRNKNWEPGYDDSQERQDSDLAVDKQCFKDAEATFSAVSKDLLHDIDAVHNENDAGEEVKTLRERARKVGSLTERFVPVYTVAFLGNTESGKSSSINALMNEDEIAPASDDGSSGTHVIHEYLMSEADQTTKFRAVIHYHPARKIDSIVAEHFANYYEFSHCERDEMDEDSYEELRQKSNTAFDFFLSLLGGPGSEPNFKTEKSAIEMLAGAKSAKDEALLELLKGAIKAYLASLNLNVGATVINANSFQELNEQKRLYAGPPKGKGLIRSPWRLVRLINVHLSARILEEGMRLADLPGLSDSDQTRVQSTKDYIKTCSAIVITHPIGRVTTNDAVERNLNYCIHSGKADNTILLCTKTDDFAHDRIRDLSKTDADSLARLRAAEQTIVDGKAQLEVDKADAEEDGDDEEYTRLDKLLRGKEYALAAASAAIRGANIAFRNKAVEEAMRTKIKAMGQQLTGDETDMRVFCASNTIYKAHRKGYSKLHPPDLDVQGTGIPQMRRYLLETPAKMKHEKLRQAVQNMQRTIFGLELFCSRSPLERKQVMLPLVERPMLQFESQMKQSVEGIASEFNEAMTGLVFTYEVGWKKEGAAKTKEWAKLHHSRFKQFCRRNGLHKMEKFGDEVDWNESIVSIISKVIFQALVRMMKTLMGKQEELRDTLDGLLLTVNHSLKDGAQTIGTEDDMNTFYRSVDNKRDIVRARINDLFDVLMKKELVAIRHAATSHDDLEKSYVLKFMLDTYTKCALESGDGAHGRRKEMIKSKLAGSQNIYLDIIQQIVVDFNTQLEQWAIDADGKLGKFFSEVIQDFHSRFDNDEIETEDKKMLRAKLLAGVYKAQEVMNGKLKAELDECRKYK